MKKYKVLEHTADIMIEAYGNTLGELFENAAVGMCEQVVEKKVTLRKAYRQRGWDINPMGDLESDLVGFLNSIKNDLYDNNFYPIYFECIGEIILVTGDILDAGKTVFSDEIKAVTYHEMKITRDKNGIWKTKVVFDV